MEKMCQTDITLLSGSNISSFRPAQFAEEISPYPPLPVIETTSGLHLTFIVAFLEFGTSGQILLTLSNFDKRGKIVDVSKH